MSWIHTAKVGDKIVLVDDDWPEHVNLTPSVILPEIGPVYTIRNIAPDIEGVVYFQLAEIINKIMQPPLQPHCAPMEPWFRSDRFRPVHNTDISVFQHMLKTAPAELEKA